MAEQPPGGTERAIFGDVSTDEIAAVVDRFLVEQLGARLASVVFRAGRIDAVWAVLTSDGREVVVKAHRPPVDLVACRAARTGQQVLVDAGFPCPTPLAGPHRVGDVVLSGETLVRAGSVGDGHDPATRRGIAASLAEHVEILRERMDLIATAGRGPAWCRYQDGPWPTPHDSIFDFTLTPDGYAWLDAFARRAADQVLAGRGQVPVVVGHADWYCGNLRFDQDHRLVGSFDWELVADTEPVIAGLTAACYAARGTAGADLSDPDEVAAFLVDYDAVLPRPLSPAQQRVAAAAAAWVIAYNARCELGLLSGAPAARSALELAREHHERYLDLAW